MKEQLKASVLAKCEEATNHRDKWILIGEHASGLALEYFTDDHLGYFQIGSPHHVICLKFNEETHSESIIWQIAAAILGIKPKEERPSDALLTEAFEIGRDNTPMIGTAKFGKWLATLPADGSKT